MKHSWKKQAWKYATAFIVALIILNPEMAGLALFIDAVGLEMFLMLIEVQIFVVLGMLIAKFKPIFSYLKNKYERNYEMFSWQNIAESLLLRVPSQATVMSLLVVSAFIQITYTTI